MPRLLAILLILSGLARHGWAQASSVGWKPHLGVGRYVGGAATMRQKQQQYAFEGSVYDLGLERAISPHRTIRFGATVFDDEGGDNGSCTELGCIFASRPWLLAGTLDVHRADRGRWGPATSLGVAGMHLQGFGHRNTLTNAVGATASASLSAPAVFHFAPTLGYRHYLLLRSDKYLMQAAAIELSLKSR